MLFFPSFSRRIGKSLSAAQKQVLKDRLPQLTITLPEAEGEMLPVVPPLWLEIGFGSGEHLAGQAVKNRDTRFIGCEPYINGVVQLVKAIDLHNLENVCIWQDDARDLLLKLPDGSLDRVFILFPDPWPKKKHHRRRIISDATLDLLQQKMRPGAELRVATDHEDYAAWMLEHLSRHPGFTPLVPYPEALLTPPEDWVKTRYQEKAEAEGIQAKFFRFARK